MCNSLEWCTNEVSYWLHQCEQVASPLLKFSGSAPEINHRVASARFPTLHSLHVSEITVSFWCVPSVLRAFWVLCTRRDNITDTRENWMKNAVIFKIPHIFASDITQGHLTTVLCKISVRRSKYWQEFSISWWRLKISKWPFHSCTIFEAYLINSLRFPEVQVLHFASQVRLFFVEKRKPKIFGFKNVMERAISKCLTFVIRQILSKIFGRIILKPFV